jgi:hypothetical protein
MVSLVKCNGHTPLLDQSVTISNILYRRSEIWYNYSMIIPLALETTKKADRSCGSCTKCCDGWLSGTAYGHDFSPGKPCYFANRSGCSIYPIRPESPCKTFVCHWKENTQIPDWLTPAKSGIIILIRYLESQRYLRLTYAGRMPTEQILEWAEQHAATGANIVGFDNTGVRIFSNNEKFKQAAAREFGI